MPLELRKSSPVRLRSIGLDERWLQERIAEDPAILGLGDLDVIRREKQQPSGGRIDFLMYDPEEETRYEIEVMLGTLDETHIVRAIEYWDLERQRYPTREHRAVIVAEEITGRFFNIIRLLNRSVPIIALQLNAFVFEQAIVLQFTKVLDVLETADELEEASTDRADRAYWVSRATPASLEVADQIVRMVVTTSGSPRVTYNHGHIALGTTGRNFCWFHPRKSVNCHMELKPGADNRDAAVTRLVDAGVDASPRRKETLTFSIDSKRLAASADTILSVLAECEIHSRRAALTVSDEE